MPTNRLRFDLLRHGACEGGHIFRGSTDVALTEEGWRHMQDGLAKLEGGWTRIISSPMRRCRDFAETIAEKYRLELDIEPSLREMSFGDWEGQSVEKVWREHAALCSAWSSAPDQVTPPAAEAYTEFRARVLAALADLQERFASNEKTLLVTHGGVIRLLLHVARGTPASDMMQLSVGYGFAASMQLRETDGPLYEPPLVNQDTLQILAPNEAEYVYQG